MHNFHFRKPPEDALPPSEIRFIELNVDPWPDGRRVRVLAEITPAQQSPNLDFDILDGQGNSVSHVRIIECAESRITFTMHIRTAPLSNSYTLTGSISYTDLGSVDERKCPFTTQETPTQDEI